MPEPEHPGVCYGWRSRAVIGKARCERTFTLDVHVCLDTAEEVKLQLGTLAIYIALLKEKEATSAGTRSLPKVCYWPPHYVRRSQMADPLPVVLPF